VEAGPDLTSTACHSNSHCTRRSPKSQHKGAQQPYQWQLTRTTVSLKTYSRHFHPQPQLSRHPAQGTRGPSKEHATSAASTDTKQSTAVKSKFFAEEGHPSSTLRYSKTQIFYVNFLSSNILSVAFASQHAIIFKFSGSIQI
jgi:hypothetical protein